MNIDLKKKKDNEFMEKIAYKGANYLKDVAQDAVDHFIDPEKHSFANKLLSNIVKATHNTYVDENNLRPKLRTAPDREDRQPELPATITRIEEPKTEPELKHEAKERRV